MPIAKLCESAMAKQSQAKRDERRGRREQRRPLATEDKTKQLDKKGKQKT